MRRRLVVAALALLAAVGYALTAEYNACRYEGSI